MNSKKTSFDKFTKCSIVIQEIMKPCIPANRPKVKTKPCKVVLNDCKISKPSIPLTQSKIQLNRVKLLSKIARPPVTTVNWTNLLGNVGMEVRVEFLSVGQKESAR